MSTGGHAMDRRAGLFLAVKLLFVVGLVAVGWMLWQRRDGVAGGAPRSSAPATNAPSSVASEPGVASQAAPAAATVADHWMQPYRRMTLDQAFDEVARRVRFEPYAGIQRGARGTARAK